MADQKKQTLGFWLILLSAVVLAAWGMLPPSPRPASDNGPNDYSLARTLPDLRAITRAPRPAGSAENARVREYLAERLRDMGLKVEIQRGMGVRQSPRAREFVAAAPVANIIAVLPGRDSRQPAVAVMAHYDSVPFSFGASDDGAGTVAVLETARALLAGPTPQRDVVFLLTDGEEMGLLGAQMFFDDHPLARRIGMVVNAEARGSKGLAAMFQTSPRNAALIDLWASTAIRPSGNSVSDAAYRLLPNDTDLSVPLLKGIGGINTAYGSGHFDYHSTTDSFDTIDHGALQHLGDFTLTMTRELAMAHALPASTRDAVYFDIFGWMVVRYPPWLGWVPLILGAAGLLLLYRRESALPIRLNVGAFAAMVGATLFLTIASHAIGVWQLGSGAARMREVMAEIDLSIWVMAALVLAALLLLRPGRALRLGAAAMLLLVGVAAQMFLPGAAFLFAWPALVAVLLMLARNGFSSWRYGWILDGFIVAMVLGLVLNLLAYAYIMVGLLSAGVMALALPFLAALLPEAPLASRRAGGLALALVAVALGWFAVADGFSTRHPRPGDQFVLHSEGDGKVRHATTSDARYLPVGRAEPFQFEPFNRRPMLAVPASGIALQTATGRLDIRFEHDGSKHRWDLAIQRPPRLVTIAVRPDGPLTNVRLAGRPITLKAGEWTRVAYRAPQPVVLALEADGPATTKLAIRYQLVFPWADKSPTRMAKPITNWTLLSGSDVIVGEWKGSR
jgi:hypothetical protein